MKLVARVMRTAYYQLRSRSLDLRPWSELARRTEIQGASLAIVGNAGYLARLDQGPFIDGHDLVLRMNNFRTNGFEGQVGRRCDIFISGFCHDVDLRRPELRAARYIVSSIPANFRKLPDLKIHTRGGEWITAGLLALGRRAAYAPDVTGFAGHVTSIGRYPTTGATAILLALEQLASTCPRVFITGFSFFEGPTHYFSSRQIVPRNHDICRERELLRTLLAPAVAGGRVSLDPVMHQHLFGSSCADIPVAA
jgi:Glycosyltransferase family 29 (sialyltransferase)